MVTEYPLGKKRKQQLLESRKQQQQRARRRIIADMPRISMALHANPDVRGAWWDERTGNMYFGWFGRNINYSVTTQTMLVKYGKDTAVYTHYTTQQLLDALALRDVQVAPKLFSTKEDFRL